MAPASFANKVAVVTGGASGIGAAVVDVLRGGGATVEIADTAADRSRDRIDVTSAGQVEGFAGRVRQEHRHCDILINCAGAIAVGTAVQCTESDWDRVFAVNVRAAWLMSKHFLPLMDGGAVVNVSSGAGLRAIPDMAAYVAAKHAVVGLTRAMAIDHAGQGVRVNCVCPGLVDTPLAHKAQELRPSASQEAVDGFEGYLIKRAAQPTDLADTICFLASEAARHITGATLAVDGGRCMH